MSLYDHGVPRGQGDQRCCVRCFAPLRETTYACAPCWNLMSTAERDEIQRSDDGRSAQHRAAFPGGMVETKAYNPMLDVAIVMAYAQEKCKFGAQKELWNHIVGELAERFVHRSGGSATEFLHWCHGGSGSGGGYSAGGGGSYNGSIGAAGGGGGRATMWLDEPIPTVSSHAALAAGYGMSQARIHDYLADDPLQDPAEMAHELVRSMQPPAYIGHDPSLDPALMPGRNMTATEIAERMAAPARPPTVQDVARQADQSMIDRYMARRRNGEP